MGASRGQGNGTYPTQNPPDPDGDRPVAVRRGRTAAPTSAPRRAGELIRSSRVWPTGWVIFAIAAVLLVLILLVGLVAPGFGRALENGTDQVPGVGGSASPTPRSSATPNEPKSTDEPSSKPSRSAEPTKVPASGPRRYTMADLSAGPKSKRGTLLTYNVRVQKNLPYDAEDTARFIHQTLNDRRSWGRSGDWRLRLVGPGKKADFEVFLVTRNTTDRLCAPLLTRGKVSCFNEGRVVLNADRWAYGAKSYGKRVHAYRQNLVNHEVGHALGHGHVMCPGKGKRAPIMMQQTKGLHGCRANPWPYPKAN